MGQCLNCSAPLSFGGGPTECVYCKTVNHPPPAKVEVPVPVQVVHNVVHLSSGSDLRALRCPHCEKRLVGARADGVDLNGCVACGGIWIDSASCQRVVARPREVFEELARRAAANARGPVTRARRPKCPVCDDAMDPVTVKEIPLDVCAEHGTCSTGVSSRCSAPRSAE